MNYYEELMKDVRFCEGLSACMNCGICTSVCAAAEYYNYDPRQIVITVSEGNNDEIEKLLSTDTIWYCGECMSCRPRCPRGNTPGYVIQALRTLSQKTGLFVKSEKGRQQLALKRVIGENILRTGYCITPKLVAPALHPEQSPVWKWVNENDKDVFDRFGENYQKIGSGAFRSMTQQTLDELENIFKVTGGREMYDTIEKFSVEAAKEMGMDAGDEYLKYVLTTNSGEHHGV